MKQKNKLYHKCLQTKSVEDFTNYKKLKDKLKKQPKEHIFRNLFKTSESLKNINQLIRKNKLKAAFLQSMKVNGKMITCPQQICIELNEHFVEVGEKFSAKLQQTTQKICLKIF